MSDISERFKLFHILNQSAKSPMGVLPEKDTNEKCKHLDTNSKKHKTICTVCGKVTIETGKDNKEWMNHGMSYHGKIQEFMFVK